MLYRILSNVTAPPIELQDGDGEPTCAEAKRFVCYMYDMFETEKQFARFYIPCQHTSGVVVLTSYFCVYVSVSLLPVSGEQT